jgi:large subunit ribosomal protein L3
MRGLIGRKVGMTQVYNEAGQRVAVTVISVAGNIVVQKKTSEGRDGYNAVKLAFDPADKQEKNGMVRYRGANKPEAGVFEKAGIETPCREVREFRVTASELDTYEVGAEASVESHFYNGEIVDVTGTSKGRGYTGVIKRHNFHMSRATHGTHEFFRHGGSIGSSAWPSKVWKGKKMAGQYGNTRVTTQNVKIERIDPDNGLILLRGAVPGPVGGIVTVRSAIKRSRAASRAA